jgi:hypothetical protein
MLVVVQTRCTTSMIVDVGFDVIRRAQAGEHLALTRLVETYQGQVYSLALAIMRDRADAAACMGVPLNTVKSHILRGRERLLRVFGGYGAGAGRGPGHGHGHGHGQRGARLGFAPAV